MADGEAVESGVLQTLFEKCDPAGTGYISQQDLIDGYKELNLGELTEEDADVLFTKLGAGSSKGRDRQVSYHTLALGIAEWASQEQAGSDVHIQEPLPHTSAGHEVYEGDGMSFAAPSIAVSDHDQNAGAPASFNASDIAELVWKYNADASGLSLRSVLVEQWQLLETDAQCLIDCLKPSMSDARLGEVIAECLRDLDYSVNSSTDLASHLIPTLVVEPFQNRRTPRASPSINRRRSASFRVGSDGGHGHQLTRRGSLGDSNVGVLKDDMQVRQLWDEMKNNQPQLLDEFEQILGDVSQKLQMAEEEKEQLKAERDREARDLNRRAMELDKEANEQIEIAKAKVKREERSRLQNMREELSRQVAERDHQLEKAMDNLTQLQSQVRQLEGKGRSMESQYGEMEEMKAKLEEALDAQRAKHLELEAQIAESAALESTPNSRPPSRSRISSESEQEALVKHVNTLTFLNHTLKRRLRDRTDELVASEQYLERIEPLALSEVSRLEYGSSDFSTQQMVNRPISASPSFRQRSKAKYTSDEDGLSKRPRRKSFRQSRKGATPRVKRASIVRRAPAGDSGDDEGSPGHDVPDGSSRHSRASSSDSDMNIDDAQATSTPYTSRSGPPRMKKQISGIQSDGDLALPRRHSLSPDDLVPGYFPGHRVTGYPEVNPSYRQHSVSPRANRKRCESEILTVVTPPPEDTQAEGFVYPDNPLDMSPQIQDSSLNAKPEEDVSLAVQLNERGVPLASVLPITPSTQLKRPRGGSVRTRPKHTQKTRQYSVDDSVKQSTAPAVVHPIKAQPAKHSTMQYPITDDLVNQVGLKPERVFKVVFCGDSGVGKSSYIWRVCNEDDVYEQSNFSTTIGLDFQTKLMSIEGHQTVLQLWDTAGQERFRTFTKQYFRKADGVICLYDICNSKTFMNVREWMDQIREATGDETAVMLLGNKIDMADLPPRPKRQVTFWQGQQLAQQSGALFAEVSAMSGHNAVEACNELGKILLAAEKKVMDGLLTLDRNAPEEEPKKKSCC